MHVMLTGSTGLVGAALTPFLTGQGHQVRRLRREPSGEAETTHWNPADGTFARGAFDGIDAVVHGDRYRPRPRRTGVENKAGHMIKSTPCPVQYRKIRSGSTHGAVTRSPSLNAGNIGRHFTFH